MDNKQITQEQFVIEKLATENARLKIAIEQLNFKILVQEQEIENLKSKGENKEEGRGECENSYKWIYKCN